MGCCESKEDGVDPTEHTRLLGSSPASPGKSMTVVLEEPISQSLNVTQDEEAMGRAILFENDTAEEASHEAARCKIEADLIDVTERAARAFVITVPDDGAMLTTEEVEHRGRAYTATVSRCLEVEEPLFPMSSVEPVELDAVLSAEVMPCQPSLAVVLTDLATARNGIGISHNESVYFDLNTLDAVA
eukprot:m.203741 g.203741  ORF g.203741 m.203741 type:complete len:187 (+) comp25284_c0_seq2:70-630(+)